LMPASWRRWGSHGLPSTQLNVKNLPSGNET